MIQQMGNWLGDHLAALEPTELKKLFEEIHNFRETGILEKGKLRVLEKEFSGNVSHTRGGECMRLVEDAVLYEISRRYYNEHI